MSKHKASSPPPRKIETIEDINADPRLMYKLKVLIYDIFFASKRGSYRRLASTTDELYLSRPYFTPEEAAAVRQAITYDGSSWTHPSGPTVEEALMLDLGLVFDEGNGYEYLSRDNTHDIANAYLTVFSIDKEEILSARFEDLVEREGLGTPDPSPSG